MRKQGAFLFFSLLFLVLSCSEHAVLFQQNAKDWETFGDAEWQFSKATLIGQVQEGAGFVMTNKTYTNFTLELEFKPDSTINSGVFIRCHDKELSATDCHELNIWDLHPNQDFRTGAIVTKAVPMNYVETLNKWNTYKVEANENRIQVWVNNTLTADSNYDYPTTGFIGLQAMGTGKIEFRNIKISKNQ